MNPDMRPATAKDIFAPYQDPKKFIILLPVDDDVLSWGFVQIEARTLQFKQDEWYNVGGGRFALTKPALLRLAAKANISVTESRRSDNGLNPDYAEHFVSGHIMQSDMTLRAITGHKSISVQIMLQRDAKSLADKDNIPYEEALRRSRNRNEASYQQFRGERAETGAYERMIRNALAMKTGYEKEDTTKTFVVPAVVPNMQLLMRDPEGRARLLDQALGGARMLYPSKNETPAGMVLDQGYEKPILPAHEEDLPFAPEQESLEDLLKKHDHGLNEVQVKKLLDGDEATKAAGIAWLKSKPVKQKPAAQSAPPPEPSRSRRDWTPSEAQMKRLYAIAAESGYTRETLLYACNSLGYSPEELTREQYDHLCGDRKKGIDSWLENNPWSE